MIQTEAASWLRRVRTIAGVRCARCARKRTTSAETQALIDAWRARRSARQLKSSPVILGGGTHVVQNCNDAGAGSLRTVIAGAADTDTIDMTELACSTITLTTGQINIPQDNLQILGPGAGELAISGNEESRVFSHYGLGTLSIDAVTISDGFKYLNADSVRGGCIYSNGAVDLSNAEILDCIAVSTSSGTVEGGGVFAKLDITATSTMITGNIAANKYEGVGFKSAQGGGLANLVNPVQLTDCLVTDNDAYSSASFASRGGGVYAPDSLTAKYTQISRNAADTGGGLYTSGDVTIGQSTISENDALQGGGAWFVDGQGTDAISVRSSTISGNNASLICGGMYIGELQPQALIANSTITSNTAGLNIPSCGGGVGVGAGDLRLESTIMAGNFAEGEPSDLMGSHDTAIVGANNLVFESNLQLPADTLLLVPPLLGPLAFNGGGTQTHALLFDSPALDAGNAIFGGINDQRGAGFPRLMGAQVDIGAYERLLLVIDDTIFADGFELP